MGIRDDRAVQDSVNELAPTKLIHDSTIGAREANQIRRHGLKLARVRDKEAEFKQCINQELDGAHLLCRAEYAII